MSKTTQMMRRRNLHTTILVNYQTAQFVAGRKSIPTPRDFLDRLNSILDMRRPPYQILHKMAGRPGHRLYVELGGTHPARVSLFLHDRQSRITIGNGKVVSRAKCLLPRTSRMAPLSLAGSYNRASPVLPQLRFPAISFFGSSTRRRLRRE